MPPKTPIIENPKIQRVLDALHSPSRLSALDLIQPSVRQKLVEDHCMDFFLTQIETAASFNRLSDREICRRAKLSPMYMHLLRNERKLPNVKTLCQIANAFDCAAIVQLVDFKHLLDIINDIHLLNPLVLTWDRTYSPGELEGMKEQKEKERLRERVED